MIWNPWKRIRELELELFYAKKEIENAESAKEFAIKHRGERITELEGDLALALGGHIEALNNKVKAQLQVNSSMTQSLYSQLAAAHNLRNAYSNTPMGWGVTGGIF